MFALILARNEATVGSFIIRIQIERTVAGRAYQVECQFLFCQTVAKTALHRQMHDRSRLFPTHGNPALIGMLLVSLARSAHSSAIQCLRHPVRHLEGEMLNKRSRISREPSVWPIRYCRIKALAPQTNTASTTVRLSPCSMMLIGRAAVPAVDFHLSAGGGDSRATSAGLAGRKRFAGAWSHGGDTETTWFDRACFGLPLVQL